jgi:hypothetical protein
MPNANRYWVGGTGTWSSSSTTKWSASSGISFTGSRTGFLLTTTGSPALTVGMTLFSSSGTASGTISTVNGANSFSTSSNTTLSSQAMSAATIGASVPDATDNVFFDANSNMGTTSFTITMANAPRVCKNLTISGLDGTMTLAGTGINLTVSGSLSFPATNLTRTYTGLTTFAATSTGNTITPNGKTFPNGVTFDGVGGAWTLGSALDCTTSTITLNNGTFDTGGYAVTAGALISDNSTSGRTLNLNSSTVTLTNSSTPFQLINSPKPTLNAGTSTINLQNILGGFTPLYAYTYYNLNLNNNGNIDPINFSASNNTFNTLNVANTSALSNIYFGANTVINTLTASKTYGLQRFTFYGNSTINTLNVNGDSSNYGGARIMFASDSIGTQRSIAVTSISTLSSVDFRDIAITGITASGLRLGDCGGNSGITFDSPKTVYYAAVDDSQGWGGPDAWANSIGGTPSYIYFPLAQDTAVFPATYPVSGTAISISYSYNIGTVDMSARTTNTIVLGTESVTPTVYGDWTNGTGTTLSGFSNGIIFAGRKTQTLTTAGINFRGSVSIFNLNNTVRIVGNTGSSIGTTYLYNSTLDLNGYTFDAGNFTVNNGGSPNLTFNGGTLKTTRFTNNALLTTTQGSAQGKIIIAGISTNFDGGGRTYDCTLQIDTTSGIQINGSNTFTTITNTTSPLYIYFQDNSTTTVTNWNVNGTPGNLVVLISNSAGPATFNLSKSSGIVSSDYLNISYSNAIGGAAWYAGSNSVDGGGNTGWIFTAPPTVTYDAKFLQFF